MNQKLPQWLAARLKEPLPGPMIGSRFEPSPCPWRHDDVVPSDARSAAVLILLYPHQGRWHVPLTLRPATMAAHAGQVSLPGGALDPGETAAEAAIREFHEELGDDGQTVELLGSLSPFYVQASHYLVMPWTGVVASRPHFEPNPAEVDEVLEVPLEHLLDPTHFGCKTRHHKEQPYCAPCFFFQSHHIWGATCMILGELITILEELNI